MLAYQVSHFTNEFESNDMNDSKVKNDFCNHLSVVYNRASIYQQESLCLGASVVMLSFDALKNSRAGFIQKSAADKSKGHTSSRVVENEFGTKFYLPTEVVFEKKDGKGKGLNK